ncbi:tetratricopeptide repeat protein [Yunchengibacter salinarum]|uniref:tetratricopeptide repeat protein n=1 Tax=Yunchengibacter salinarum TaxID=3133399 RepID=UPI0035B63728
MIRVLLLFALFLVVSALAAWLAGHPGRVTLALDGALVSTSLAALAALIAAAALGTGGAVWLWMKLRRDMPFFGEGSVIARQRKGFHLMNKALVALSADDHRLARRLVEQAETLLPEQPMVHLIAAEAASRAGDRAAAAERYRALERGSEGRLIGLRGLVGEARRQGREAEALDLARDAFSEHRRSPWVLKTLFALEVASGHWQAARDALKKVAMEGLLDKETVRRHRAALAFAEASAVHARGDQDAARRGFMAALKDRPDFPPAVARLARLDLEAGRTRRAERRLEQAWKAFPHPTLLRLYKELDPTESAHDWRERVENLVRARPDHMESLLARADAAMQAGDMAAARPLLDRLTREAPSRRAWQLRLALAHALGEETDAIEAALATSEEGGRWTCGDCGHRHLRWTPLCGQCGAFDSLDWLTGADVRRSPRFDAERTIALLQDSAPPHGPGGRPAV